MPIPEPFAALASHPAPGLHFPPHPAANTPQRIVPCSHHFGSPASDEQIAELRRLTAKCPALSRELEEIFREANGMALCCVPDEDGPAPLLTILPIEEWQAATDELASGDLQFLIEGCQEAFPPGGYVVLGFVPNEETRLILSLAGRFEGVPTAGKILYASMDPVLDIGQPIAGSLEEFLERFADNPAAMLEKIGASYFLEKDGELWGDTADRYLADVRAGR